MRYRNLLDFAHQENAFLDLLTADCDNYASTWIPQGYFILGGFLEHLELVF